MEKFNEPSRISRINMFRTASIFLVFAILCSLFYIPCYVYIRKLHQNRSLEQHQYNLESNMQLLDTSIESVLNLNSILKTNGNMLWDYTDRSQYNDSHLSSIRHFISKYIAPYDFIYDVGIVNQEELLLNRFMIFYEREPLNFTQYFHCDQDDYLEQFCNNYSILPLYHFYSSTIGEYDAITLACQLSRLNDTYFFVHYPSTEIYNLFSNDDILQHCRLIIYSNDEILMSNIPELTEEYEEIKVDSRSLLNLKITLQLPYSYLEKDLIPLQKLAIAFISIVIFAFCLWICLFTFMLSKPFNRISKALYSTGHINSPQCTNSTDFLVSAINQLDAKISDYSQIIETQKERSRTHLLERALNRGLYTEDAKQLFAETFPDFPSKWLLVLLQYVPDDENIKSDAIQAALFQYIGQTLPYIICLPFAPDSILMIFSLDSKNSPDLELSKLCSHYEALYPISLSYTLGNSYNDPAFLADAFQQIEYDSMVLQRGSVPGNRNPIRSITMQQLQTIYNALQSGDAKTAITSLNNITVRILDSKDRVSAKYSYRALSYMLLQLILENPNIKSIPLPVYRSDNITKLFQEDFPSCFSQIAVCITQQRENQTQSLEVEILEYLSKNYSNQQLSITAVTNHFHISAPTLQKRIGACTGKTFSAYVEDLRMNKARQALLDTTLTIQEIAESVGYTNTNSFYKAYRRVFGESPRSTRQGFDD